MILCHRTTSQAAVSILSNGFKDAEGTYGTDRLWTGVWISNRPLDCHEGTPLDADILFEVHVPEETLADYEWIEDGKPYREWLVPAALLNRYATLRVATVEGGR